MNRRTYGTVVGARTAILQRMPGSIAGSNMPLKRQRRKQLKYLLGHLGVEHRLKVQTMFAHELDVLVTEYLLFVASLMTQPVRSQVVRSHDFNSQVDKYFKRLSELCMGH